MLKVIRTVHVCGCTGTTVYFTYTHAPAVAGNGTVPNSVWRGGGVRSAKCPSVKVSCESI